MDSKDFKINNTQFKLSTRCKKVVFITREGCLYIYR